MEGVKGHNRLRSEGKQGKIKSEKGRPIKKVIFIWCPMIA